MRQEGLRDDKRRERVDFKSLAKAIEIHVERGLAVRADDTGIVDQDVDGVSERCGRPRDRCGVGDVEDEGAEVLAERRRITLAPHRAYNPPAAREGVFGEGEADAAMDAGDEDGGHAVISLFCEVARAEMEATIQRCANLSIQEDMAGGIVRT
jgi:hypothetical protein